MKNSEKDLEQGLLRKITLPLRTLILGSNLILVLGLVLGVSLWPYFLKSLSKMTGLEKGAITYGQFRNLSTGMSETAVLATAREPYDRNTEGRWVYFRDDGSVVTLSFEKGKLRRINPDALGGGRGQRIGHRNSRHEQDERQEENRERRTHVQSPSRKKMIC